MIGRDTKKAYANGFAFFDDLLKYGEVDAVKMANTYLDLPIEKGDHEEQKFREELYSACKNYKTAIRFLVIVNDRVFCNVADEESANKIAEFYKGRVEKNVVYSPFAKV